jgi:pimeloyl-ACP methyl ester carboxylesterase
VEGELRLNLHEWEEEAGRARVSDFTLENPLGLAIRGKVINPAEAREHPPTVFAVHGYKGFINWGFFPLLFDTLAGAGLRVVAFNLSGSGIGADGETCSETGLFERNTYSQEILDIQTVVRAFTKGANGAGFPPAGATALFGHSRGGGTALLSAANIPRLQTIVTWASICRVDRWSDADKQGWRERGYLEVVNSRTEQTFKLTTDLLNDVEENGGRLDLETVLRGLTIPILIVHGDKDEAVGPEEGRRLFAWKAAHSGEEAPEAQSLPEELQGLPAPPETILRWGPERSLLAAVGWAGHTFDAVHPLPDPPPERLLPVIELTTAWLRFHLLDSYRALS